ncbi:hypothetical protein AS888_12740 [Peribacillus simplex]|uniref:Uncharacterized protein n=1 Tax=Peribacillus simplex TaxID=1478 RepID=A0A109N2N8_9BACI|nr:hypothetical protein AS888_12740 [Peribacillus simplex]
MKCLAAFDPVISLKALAFFADDPSSAILSFTLSLSFPFTFLQSNRIYFTLIKQMQMEKSDDLCHFAFADAQMR